MDTIGDFVQFGINMSIAFILGISRRKIRMCKFRLNIQCLAYAHAKWWQRSLICSAALLPDP